MAITTGDGYIGSAKQIISYTKATMTTVAYMRYSPWASAGSPGAGTLAATAAPGALYTDATNGAPIINAFGGGATGYLTRVQYSGTVVERLELWDKIYGVSLTPSTGTTTITGPPAISGRVPGGTDYTGLRMFVEVAVNVSAAAATVYVTYTDQDGNAGATSGTTASLASMVAGRWIDLPFAAGDSGVRKIDTVVVGGASATGTINIIIARPLWGNRVPIAGAGGIDGIDRTGMPVVYADSCLTLTTIADSTASGIPDLNIEIANA